MGHKILVIEDQEQLALVLKEYLGDCGFSVQIATTGREALNKVEQSKFGVLVTDFKLPDMDGLAVAEKARERSPSLKIVFVTGYKMQLKKSKIQVGPDCQIIEKPCRPKKILEAINKVT
ncbi:response regulator [candidate division KSB1 bacterium]|nr:response regulator [candidate division KSB1 bacterium]NIR72526.1 response regulator [candidate division KSB1 bacterium]NIS23825.1 response regulator [candidate division KSB1 bacterium]NIT70752.1 response regulator [candidate division KSB1 bacterium]NIU24267.1 response regulator [candidate division KSB1 bacterium]